MGEAKAGGQVRDEHRQDYDAGRGGWGAQAQRLEIERRRKVKERYADATVQAPWQVGVVTGKSVKALARVPRGLDRGG